METLDIETIVFAVIAVIVLARLWFVLGRKNEGDRQRPNPFTILVPGADARKNAAKDDDSDAAFIPGRAQKGGEAMAPLHIIKVAPASLEGGLAQIKSLDPSFDEKLFLQKARSDFAAVVGDFAKGDMGDTAKLLAPSVLSMFKNAIDARKAAGQKTENRVARITEAETAAAKAEGDRGVITVRFVSEQENILRDSEDKIIGGEAGKLEEITDLWVFAREMKVQGSLWILVETHG